MNQDKPVPNQVRANFAFNAFLFLVFGWALFETQLFRLSASVRAHLLISMCGFVVSVIALRRCRQSWLSFAEVGAAVERSAPNRYHIGKVASCVALVAAGCVLALCAQLGSIAIFAFCAGAFSLIPWSRIAFCRRHFFTSCTMLGAGAVSIFLAVKGAQNHPLLYLFYAWVLWIIALSELLITWKPDRLSRQMSHAR